MDVHHVKSEEQMDILTIFQQMDKFPDLFEPSTFANYIQNPNAVASINTISDDPLHQPPSLPPYSDFAAAAASQKQSSMAAMREMIYRIAAMQPIHIDPESVKPPKRRNVKISKDPQSVAARHRRERISERIRILQRIVPGGTKMDTASMLDEAIHYVKFLKNQVKSLEIASANRPCAVRFPVAVCGGSYMINGSKSVQQKEDD